MITFMLWEDKSGGVMNYQEEDEAESKGMN